MKESGLTLAIDIGLRNLSMCIMSAKNHTDMSTYQIHLWDNFNTLDCDDHSCESLQKNGKVCGKKCTFKYKKEDSLIYTCKTHFPKDITVKREHTFKKKNVDDYLLQDIADIVLQRVQNIYDTNINIFKELTSIIIELQPKINQKMKFTSHIIYGKLVDLYRSTKCTIRFVRASQKLKAYTGEPLDSKCKLKGAYAKRKWLSKQYTIWFLENKFNKEQSNKWLSMLLSQKKTDDSSDTFLMSINAIAGIPKKERIKK